MSEPRSEPVELYRATSLPEAHALRLALEQEGIRVIIDNETLQGVVGELPMGWPVAPRILVDSANLDSAQMVLNRFVTKSDAILDDEMVCLACQTPMGEAEKCPKCGWTYSPEKGDTVGEKTEAADSDETDSTNEVPLKPEPRVWFEIAAVASISVIPYTLNAVIYRLDPTAPSSFAIEAMSEFATSIGPIMVTLFVISRSGLTWNDFGVTRPGLLDVLIGLLLVVVVDASWPVILSLPFDYDFPRGPAPPRPATTIDHLCMWFTYFVGAFCEEFVFRSYLITRLKSQLRSRLLAVLVAAVLFATFHLYQNLAGFLNALATGLVFGSLYLVRPRIWTYVIAHALVNISITLSVGKG